MDGKAVRINAVRMVLKMSASRRSKIMDPQAYDAMNRFKMECAADIGRTQFVKENNDHYKGGLTAKQNGSEGGPIGGEMVKRMIQQYESNLNA